MTAENTPPSTPAGSDSHAIAKAAGMTRYLIVVPILGLFVAAIAMTGVALIHGFETIKAVFDPHVDLNHIVVGFIELADIFLMAVVLYIMAIGLYELFIDSHMELPHWLEITGLDDLKEKLVSVVVVVLAIFFLGRVIEATQPIEVMYFGVGIGIVIAALGYFTSKVLAHRAE
jgi:uncharacterized protein (TIGR00645 family)